MELVRSAHSLGEANFHLQFTPKYRRDVFRDGEVKGVCEESFRETAARYGFAVHSLWSKDAPSFKLERICSSGQEVHNPWNSVEGDSKDPAGFSPQ